MANWVLIIAKQYLGVKSLLGGQKYRITGDNNVVSGEGSTINVYPQTAVLLQPHNIANLQFQKHFVMLLRIVGLRGSAQSGRTQVTLSLSYRASNSMHSTSQRALSMTACRGSSSVKT